jgi:hypothetical protein
LSQSAGGDFLNLAGQIGHQTAADEGQVFAFRLVDLPAGGGEPPGDPRD